MRETASKLFLTIVVRGSGAFLAKCAKNGRWSGYGGRAKPSVHRKGGKVGGSAGHDTRNERRAYSKNILRGVRFYALFVRRRSIRKANE